MSSKWSSRVLTTFNSELSSLTNSFISLALSPVTSCATNLSTLLIFDSSYLTEIVTPSANVTVRTKSFPVCSEVAEFVESLGSLGLIGFPDIPGWGGVVDTSSYWSQFAQLLDRGQKHVHVLPWMKH